MGPSKSRSNPHAQAASPIVIHGCSLARLKISHYRALNTIGNPDRDDGPRCRLTILEIPILFLIVSAISHYNES